MPDPRVAHCVFCDDLRYEVGNKLSFMGVYAGDIILPSKPSHEVPAVLPKFAATVWLLSDIDDRPTRLRVTLFGPPDRTEIFSVEPLLGEPPVIHEGSNKLILQISVPIMNLVIPDEGYLEVLVTSDTGELRAGRLKISSVSK